MWEVVSKKPIDWQDLESLQEELIQRVKKSPNESFLLVSEPTSTFTYGKTASPSDLLWSHEECAKYGVQIAPVSRGGQWTYHGPGQILCYPIAQIEKLGLSRKGAKDFVSMLREAVLDACRLWGIPALPSDSPYGVFVEGKKLASFGLSFSEGISSHGLALYLSPQTIPFSGIHPCGNTAPAFTCLQDFQPDLTWHRAAQTLVEFIQKRFQKSVNPVNL